MILDDTVYIVQFETDDEICDRELLETASDQLRANFSFEIMCLSLPIEHFLPV